MTTSDEPAQRRRPGRPRGGQLLAGRDDLLAAARRAINAHGPDVTMDDIAREATVTKPILYRTFGDRAALVVALSEAMIDQITTEITVALEGHTEPRAQFEAAVRGYLTAVETDRPLFLFVNAGGQPTDQLRYLIDRSAQLMVSLFAESPELAADQVASRTWAYSILGSFQIVTLMWLDADYCELDTLAADLTRLLWPGIERLGERGR